MTHNRSEMTVVFYFRVQICEQLHSLDPSMGVRAAIVELL